MGRYFASHILLIANNVDGFVVVHKFFGRIAYSLLEVDQGGIEGTVDDTYRKRVVS